MGCLWHNWRYSTYDMCEIHSVYTHIYRTCFKCFKEEFWNRYNSQWSDWTTPQPDTFYTIEQVQQQLTGYCQNKGLNISISVSFKNDSLLIYFENKVLCKIHREILKTKDQTKHLWVFSYFEIDPEHQLNWKPFHYTFSVCMNNWYEMIQKRK